MPFYITRGDPEQPFYWTGKGRDGWGGASPWSTDRKDALQVLDEEAAQAAAAKLPSARVIAHSDEQA